MCVCVFVCVSGVSLGRNVRTLSMRFGGGTCDSETPIVVVLVFIVGGLELEFGPSVGARARARLCIRINKNMNRYPGDGGARKTDCGLPLSVARSA